MPSPFDSFMQRFGGRPLGAYNPFGGSVPQATGPTYTPGAFTMSPPGLGAPQAPTVPAPGMSGLDPTQPAGRGGGGVGGQSSTDQGGAFGLGQTTRTDRTGGVINRAQNQEATLGNIARSGLMGLGVVTGGPISLANRIAGIAMNPNNPPVGGAVGALLNDEDRTTSFADNGGNPSANAAAGFSNAGAGLLSGGVTTPSTPGMAVPGGLLGAANRGGGVGGRSGGGLNAGARGAAAAGGGYSGPKGVVGPRGGSARKGAGSSGGGSGKGGGKAGGGRGRSSGGSGNRGGGTAGGDRRGSRNK